MSQTVILTPLTACNFRKKWLIFLLLFLLPFFLLLLLACSYANFSLNSHQQRGSMSCVPWSRNCISCVPSFLLQVYQIASRVVNPKHDEFGPAVSKELYQLHRNIWVYKMSNNWKVLTQFYVTLCTIICTHRELLNDIDNTVVISYYCLMFKFY